MVSRGAAYKLACGYNQPPAFAGLTYIFSTASARIDCAVAEHLCDVMHLYDWMWMLLCMQRDLKGIGIVHWRIRNHTCRACGLRLTAYSIYDRYHVYSVCDTQFIYSACGILHHLYT